MIKTIETEGGVIQYSDNLKILVDEKGNKYITAWGNEKVTETNEDIGEEIFLGGD